VKVTIVIITKDRPSQVKRLINSISNLDIPSLSLVLIDDSIQESFKRIESVLFSSKNSYEHLSSLEARKKIESILRETALATTQKSQIELCVGTHSPFLELVESLSEFSPFKKNVSTLLSRSFSPYSTARNLGIFIAAKKFNPERIVF